ncbi:MAG TPA: thiamine pyrophosphate-dependent enzyme, partial [Mobilitalea sp.]|nr:thiamine pyrophosphate-dependent enzyme [Mobilitalea sp.]
TDLNDKVDFVNLAQALGANAYRITRPDEAESVLKEALSQNEPVLVECIIDCDEKVWPMVAPGAPIDEVFTEEDIKAN